MSRPTRGAGASAAALAMCAMDPDDTEGAEPRPVDAEEKNMAGDGKKRRVGRTHDPSRHTHDTEGAELPPVDAEEKYMAGDGKKRRVERTYVAPSAHTLHTFTPTSSHLPASPPCPPLPPHAAIIRRYCAWSRQLV